MIKCWSLFLLRLSSSSRLQTFHSFLSFPQGDGDGDQVIGSWDRQEVSQPFCDESAEELDPRFLIDKNLFLYKRAVFWPKWGQKTGFELTDLTICKHCMLLIISNLKDSRGLQKWLPQG